MLGSSDHARAGGRVLWWERAAECAGGGLDWGRHPCRNAGALLWLHVIASAGLGLQPGLREGEIHAGHEQDPGALVFRRGDHELGKVLGTQKSGLTQASFPLSPGQ